VAFYFVSIGVNGILDSNPFDFAKNIAQFNTAVAQLGLFVLAFGLLMTGAGPLSLDRLLFGRGGGSGKREADLDLDEPPVTIPKRPM